MKQIKYSIAILLFLFFVKAGNCKVNFDYTKNKLVKVPMVNFLRGDYFIGLNAEGWGVSWDYFYGGYWDKTKKWELHITSSFEKYKIKSHADYTDIQSWVFIGGVNAVRYINNGFGFNLQLKLPIINETYIVSATKETKKAQVPGIGFSEKLVYSTSGKSGFTIAGGLYQYFSPFSKVYNFDVGATVSLGLKFSLMVKNKVQ